MSVVKISRTVDIEAPVERVWALTLDIERWPDHTPTMTSVERLDDGPLAVGSRARIRQPGQRRRVWTVSHLEPRRRFSWGTSLLGVRLRADHLLEPIAAERRDGPSGEVGGTRNTLVVELEGALARTLGAILRWPVQRAIAAENEGFRSAATATVAAARPT
jgi:hypothetical protein